MKKWQKMSLGLGASGAIVTAVLKCNATLLVGDRGYFVAVGVGVAVGGCVSVAMHFFGLADD